MLVDRQSRFHTMDNLIMRRARIIAVLLLHGCSLKTIALRSLADTMSAPGTTYSSDDDPELVATALPVILKTMEQIHESLPDHKGLCLALARTATSFGVAFVEEEADRLQEKDVASARVGYARARRMFLRARGYGLDGLELAAPGAKTALAHQSRSEWKQALAKVKRDDVALLYWTAAAWGSAIATAKDDMKLVGELPRVAALMERALELDEAFDDGSVHEFFITYDASRSAADGGGVDSARKHFLRARELGHNKKMSTLVSFAEAVDVQIQNKAEFVKLLDEVLAFDIDSDHDHRLVNILAQRRARWLTARVGELFAE
jgi:predicted anti-sigma-YlaC factor YlaD